MAWKNGLTIKKPNGPVLSAEQDLPGTRRNAKNAVTDLRGIKDYENLTDQDTAN
jgi:hypothetical protein